MKTKNLLSLIFLLALNAAHTTHAWSVEEEAAFNQKRESINSELLKAVEVLNQRIDASFLQLNQALICGLDLCKTGIKSNKKTAELERTILGLFTECYFLQGIDAKSIFHTAMLKSINLRNTIELSDAPEEFKNEYRSGNLNHPFDYVNVRSYCCATCIGVSPNEQLKKQHETLIQSFREFDPSLTLDDLARNHEEYLRSIGEPRLINQTKILVHNGIAALTECLINNIRPLNASLNQQLTTFINNTSPSQQLETDQQVINAIKRHSIIWENFLSDAKCTLESLEGLIDGTQNGRLPEDLKERAVYFFTEKRDEFLSEFENEKLEIEKLESLIQKCKELGLFSE